MCVEFFCNAGFVTSETYSEILKSKKVTLVYKRVHELIQSQLYLARDIFFPRNNWEFTISKYLFVNTIIDRFCFSWKDVIPMNSIKYTLLKLLQFYNFLQKNLQRVWELNRSSCGFNSTTTNYCSSNFRHSCIARKLDLESSLLSITSTALFVFKKFNAFVF